MPWSATISSTHAPLDAHPHLDRRAGLAVLHGVLDQVAERRHELAAVAEDAHAGGQLEHLDGDRAHLGQLPGPLDGAVDDVADVDDVAHRLLAELDARQLEQVVDRPRQPVRLVDHAVGDAVHDAEVVLVGQRLGQHGERPDRASSARG